jgi:hypothetical protein
MPLPISIMPSASNSPTKASAHRPRPTPRIWHVNLTGFHCQPGDSEYSAAAEATGIRDNGPIYWFIEHRYPEYGFSEQVMDFDPYFSTARESEEDQMKRFKQDLAAQRDAVFGIDDERVKRRKDVTARLLRNIDAGRDVIATDKGVEATEMVPERTDEEVAGERIKTQNTEDTRTEWEVLYEATVEQLEREIEADNNKSKGKERDEGDFEDNRTLWERELEETTERLERSLNTGSVLSRYSKS